MACRLLLSALVVLLTVGCRNQPRQLDPFLGKTTVPPPATGAIGPHQPNVLAYPAAPPTMTSPPVGAGSVPSAVPGTFTPNTSTSVPRPLSSATPPPATTTSTPAMNVSQPIRVVPPDPNRRIVAGTSSAGGIDIMDLPVRGRTTQPQTAVGSPPRGAVQSYETPAGPTYDVENAVAKTITLPGRQFAYGFNENYSQLNGRLEYSTHDGRWLLRYVSPEERPDRFGGVVVLISTGAMTGFRNGDFVSVVGRIDATGSASPVFTASTVSLQREVR